jgi:hypothetical protein
MQLECLDYCVGRLKEAIGGEASFFRAMERLVAFFPRKKRRQMVEYFLFPELLQKKAVV